MEAAYQRGYAAGRAAAAAAGATSSSSATAAAAAAGPDSLAKSAVKGLVWRVFSTAATLAVASFIFRDAGFKASDALEFGAAEFTLKYILYFAHERLWAALAARGGGGGGGGSK
jgi:uncharacterized membrane protein